MLWVVAVAADKHGKQLEIIKKSFLVPRCSREPRVKTLFAVGRRLNVGTRRNENNIFP